MPNPPPTAPIQTKERSTEFIMKSEQALVDTYAWQCCVNCDHWSEDHIVLIEDATKYSNYREQHNGPICMLYSERPPTKTIIIGCSDYVPSVPF